MKRFLILTGVVVAFTMITNCISAQTYFAYDGDEFSVMLTANTANTEITGVQFSFDGEWVDFDIVDVQEMEGSAEGGFVYLVEDGTGREYSIDYQRDTDEIYVTDNATDGNWNLQRRED